MSGYPNIADHGLIGDLQTAALVTTDGVLDWFCCPRFDSPSVFASCGWGRPTSASSPVGESATLVIELTPVGPMHFSRDPIKIDLTNVNAQLEDVCDAIAQRVG